MNCLLQICQRKRLKAYLTLMKILTLQGLKIDQVELKGGLLEKFTYELELFLRKKGVSVQPDVDHVTVSWIPANNLFAIMVSIIDQDLAQKNVYQNQGVSFPDSY
ncbi:hypothetical protein YC2023_045114 [Brassica napus]